MSLDSSLRSSSDDATRLEISRGLRILGTAAEQREPELEPNNEVSPQRSEIDEAAADAGQAEFSTSELFLELDSFQTQESLLHCSSFNNVVMKSIFMTQHYLGH